MYWYSILEHWSWEAEHDWQCVTAQADMADEHEHNNEYDDDYECEDNNMKDEQWTRDRVSIAEDAQITAQHESGHELSTARASAACSMAWPLSTKTRSPRLSIAEDALIMAQLSGSTCDSHPRPEHRRHAARPHKQDRESLKWTWKSMETAVDTNLRPRPEHPTHAARPDIHHDWRWHRTNAAKRLPRDSMDKERRHRKRRRTCKQPVN